MKYIQLVLRRPVSALLIIASVVVFGISAAAGMQMEYFPDLDMPMEVVYVMYPGADADSVERLVVKPVEDAGETLTGIRTIQSDSHENYGTVQLTYEYDTDMDDAYMELKAALDNLANDLPDNCEVPVILEVNINNDATISVAAESVDGTDITDYVNDTVVKELERINGVASVDVSGAKDRYCRIVLNEERMRQYGLSIQTVTAAIAGADFDMPVGKVEIGTQKVPANAYTDIDWHSSLTDIALETKTGEMVRLSDVSDQIGLYEEDSNSLSRYNGMNSILLGINKKSTAQTIKVCDAVEKTLASLAYPGVTYEVIHSSADDITDTLTEVLKTLIEGIVITMLVLMLFLGDWKASVIVGASMPLSMFIALTALNFMGVPFDLMTGTGMIIAIGMLVDNSIVILESCFKKREAGLSPEDAAAEGAAVMLFSVLGSTITTVVVYFPISFASGMAGQMNRPLCYAIIFTMIASLVDAVTVVPLLFTLMKPVSREDLFINRILDRFAGKYEEVMPVILQRPAFAVLTAAALLLVSAGLFAQLDFDIFPPSYNGSIRVTADFRSGTKLEVMNERIRPIEEQLTADGEFASVELAISEGSATITAYSAAGSVRTSEEAVDYYTAQFKDYTDMDINVTPYGVSTGLASLMSSGNAKKITVESEDLALLEEGTALVEEAMQTVPGVQKTKNDFNRLRSSIRFKIDQQAAQNAGLLPANVGTQIYGMLNGMTATDTEVDGKTYDIKVQFEDGRFNDPDVLMAQTITSSDGRAVPIKDICTVEHTENLQTVHRVNGRYTAEVTATVDSGNKYAISAKIDDAVKAIEFPEGVAPVQSTLDAQLAEEMGGMGTALITALFLVFLVMAVQFESVRYSLMVMLCIPFSLIGSFTFMFVMGEKISMMAMMGILMLMGMVVNNGILLVDSTNELKKELPVKEALIRAGLLRLRPILMTTLTTVLSMLPLLLTGDSGMNMMRGMGVVIIGGLLTSTVLAMFLMPPFYLLLQKNPLRRLK